MNHTNTLDKLTHSLHTSELLALKLRRLKIENYKGIDNLEIDFPSPDFKNEADITVIGSCNGIGKTSILECCTLLIEYVREELKNFKKQNFYLSINIPDLLIRAGCKTASITGVFQLAQNEYHIHLILSDSGEIFSDSEQDLKNLKHKAKELSLKTKNQSRSPSFLSFLLGSNLEPMINPLLLYFHSYRKIQEGNPELGMLSEEKNQNLIPLTRRLVGRELTLSTFKAEILRSLMAKAQLFENLDDLESEKILNKL
ncbi:MAG: ATP-binding protein, partial [Microcystaceae cyanobacterium]